MRHLISRFALILIILGFSECRKPDVFSGYISTKGQQFVDEKSRTIIFNGINHVNKNPESNYLDGNDQDIFRLFRSWGINCVRFGINWDGLEPEPNRINEEYLKEIDKRVKWAEENGIWLILDMHQDLYGRKFGNGAPGWATLDEGAPHLTGKVWSDAYLVSPAVHNSFDNFWKNTPASDGVGIQDHYINLWKIIARRYAGSPSVLGFDIMNEPYIGTAGQSVVDNLIQEYARIALEKGLIGTDAAIENIFSNDSLYLLTLRNLDDRSVYSSMVKQAYATVKDFEENILSPFYQRVRDSIRTVNHKHILFLEHNYFCNLGIPSAIRMPLDKSGNRDSLCAYAPHGYDLVTDTNEAINPGYNRLDVIFEQIFETGKKQDVPVVIGEWGAYYLNGNDYSQPAHFTVNLFEKSLAGHAYWSYWNKIETQSYFTKAIVRPYPMAVNGKLHDYRNMFDDGTFECRWTEDNVYAPTIIYIPNMMKLNKKDIRLEPESDIRYISVPKGKSGYLEIAPSGKERKLLLSFL